MRRCNRRSRSCRGRRMLRTCWTSCREAVLLLSYEALQLRGGPSRITTPTHFQEPFVLRVGFSRGSLNAKCKINAPDNTTKEWYPRRCHRLQECHGKYTMLTALWRSLVTPASSAAVSLQIYTRQCVLCTRAKGIHKQL